MEWFDRTIWSSYWWSAQVIAKDALLALELVLGLAALSWLLHQPWIGLESNQSAIIEHVHYWFSVALMIVFPLMSLIDIMKHEVRR